MFLIFCDFSFFLLIYYYNLIKYIFNYIYIYINIIFHMNFYFNFIIIKNLINKYEENEKYKNSRK